MICCAHLHVQLIRIETHRAVGICRRELLLQSDCVRHHEIEIERRQNGAAISALCWTAQPHKFNLGTTRAFTRPTHTLLSTHTKQCSEALVRKSGQVTSAPFWQRQLPQKHASRALVLHKQALACWAPSLLTIPVQHLPCATVTLKFATDRPVLSKRVYIQQEGAAQEEEMAVVAVGVMKFVMITELIIVMGTICQKYSCRLFAPMCFQVRRPLEAGDCK